jgi:hypothetical protein
MRSLGVRLWRDEVAFIVSSELVLVSTIGVLGMIVGLTTIRDQVVQELGDVAAAFSDVNQSYYWSPILGHHSSTAGSVFHDNLDDCDAPGDPPLFEPAGIWICDDMVGPYAYPYAYPFRPRSAVFPGI